MGSGGYRGSGGNGSSGSSRSGGSGSINHGVNSTAPTINRDEAEGILHANPGARIDVDNNGVYHFQMPGQNSAWERNAISSYRTTSGSQETANEYMGIYSGLAESQMAMSAEQAAIAKEQLAMSKERFKYWKDLYQPLEKQIVGQVNVGIDPAYAAARAGADVTSSFDKAQAANARNMERRGIDASSPQFVQQQAQLAIARAAAEAGARNQARNVTNDTNFSRKYAVAGLGRDIPQQAASMSGLAANTYGAAAGTLRGAAQTYQAGQQGQLAAAQMGLDASQYNAQLGFQMDQQRAQQQGALLGAVGNLAGMAIGGWASGGFKMATPAKPAGAV